jgi:hypothetical protein
MKMDYATLRERACSNVWRIAAGFPKTWDIGGTKRTIEPPSPALGDDLGVPIRDPTDLPNRFSRDYRESLDEHQTVSL